MLQEQLTDFARSGRELQGAGSLEGEQPNLEILRIDRVGEVLLLDAGGARSGEQAREHLQQGLRESLLSWLRRPAARHGTGSSSALGAVAGGGTSAIGGAGAGCAAGAAHGTEWTFAAPNGATEIVLTLSPRLIGDNFDMRLLAALAGHGVARIGATFCEAAVREGRLTRLLPDHVTTPLRVYALLPGKRLMPMKVRFLSTPLARGLTSPPEQCRLWS